MEGDVGGDVSSLPRRKGRPPKDPERADRERAAASSGATEVARQPRGVKRKKMFTRDRAPPSQYFSHFSRKQEIITFEQI